MNRREALCAIAAMPVLAAQDRQTVFFNAAELALLTRVVDAIIPRTGTPGAADAGVQFYVDAKATADPILGAVLRGGLARLGSDDLTASLTKMSESSDPFFIAIRNLTIDGYYSSKEGLVTELAWHGNTYVHEFIGCTHPEHQAGGGHAD